MPTFTLIESLSSAGSTAIFTFNTIPGTYTDLVLFLSGRGTTADNRQGVNLYFNNTTGSGYSGKEVRGFDSNSVGSVNSDTRYIDTMRMPSSNATASTFSNISFYIPNYAGSTNKSVSIDAAGQENNSSSSYYIDLAAGLWSNTSAITRIDVKAEVGNFANYSTAYLYGVSNA
jgi:hypothetical protein